MEEKRMYPPTVWSYNWLDGDPRHGEVCREIPYSCYRDAMKHRKVGDVISGYYSPPAMGCFSWQITRMDETGVYGIMLTSEWREMTEEDVI